MRGARRAVVIGIDKYETDKFAELQGAVQDATEIYNALTRDNNFTIDAKKHFLTNQRATAENVRAAINDVFYSGIVHTDIALLYFAGHGRKDYLDYGWLLPHDCDYTALFAKGIRIQDLKQLFLNPKLNIGTGIMILDCCYSGIAAEPDAEPRGGEEEADIESFRNELRLENTGSGRFILASARANEVAREMKQKHAFTNEEHVHGLYSFHLIEGLETGACDELGCVSLGKLIEYVEKQFEKGNAKHKPLHLSAGTGEFGIELTRRPEVVKKELERRYRDVDYYLKNKSLKPLIAATDILEEIGSRGDKTRQDEYFLNIRRIFENQADRVSLWWINNYKEILRASGSSHSYSLLDSIIPNVDLNTVREEKSQGFLLQVMDVILKGLDNKPEPLPSGELVQLILKYIRMRDRDKSETTAIANPDSRAGATA
jgi:hypothetical protein